MHIARLCLRGHDVAHLRRRLQALLLSLIAVRIDPALLVGVPDNRGILVVGQDHLVLWLQRQLVPNATKPAGVLVTTLRAAKPEKNVKLNI